jgi:hypothetical protein
MCSIGGTMVWDISTSQTKQTKLIDQCFSSLWGSKVGNHPKEDLAKFGYREKNRKI